MTVNYDSGLYGYNQATVTFDGTDTSPPKSRFILDASTLNDFGIGLDGSSPAFTLDTSTLDGLGKLDGYTFLTVATAASTLGGLANSATATVVKAATASASFGGLVASAQAKTTKAAVAVASLGGLEADAKGKSTKGVFANADLGSLDASATSRDVKSARLDSDLGNVVGLALAQSSQPEPPYIPPSGSRWWKQPASPVVKHEPPEQIVIQVPKPRLPLFVSAVAVTQLGGADVSALGSITFSTLADDAEVLLLI